VQAAFSGTVPVRLAWVTVLAFLRTTTSSRVFEQPLSMEEAEAAVSSWLALPSVGVLDPGERHWDILRSLLRENQVSGPLVMDAFLAALAIEHGATLCTTDRDFARFGGVQTLNPLGP
jgi:toxin-antitoxin system PIN domain toxin